MTYMKSAYVNMLHRCYNEDSTNFGKLSVCLDWRMSFDNFADDMGERPGTEYSLRLKDEATEYNPENCFWSVKNHKSVSSNVKHNSKRDVTIYDETKRFSEWCKEFKVNPSTIYSRMRSLNLTAAEAFLLGNERIKRTSGVQKNKSFTKKINQRAKLENALKSLNLSIDELEEHMNLINFLAGEVNK